jgi:hypothetical protein
MIKKYLISGFLLGLAISIGTQILTWLGLGLTNWFVLLTYILLILFVFITLRKQWITGGSSVSFTTAIMAVLIMVVVSRYVFQSYMYMYTNFIDPNWVSDVSDYWTQSLRDENVPQEEINGTIKAFQHAYEPAQMFTIEIIKYGFSQFILGLLVSLYFVLKKPPVS